MEKDKVCLAEHIDRTYKIFEEHKEFLYCSILANKPKDADDILHDFFLSLIDRPIPKNIKHVKVYLYRALMNDIFDVSRKEKARRARIIQLTEYQKMTVGNSEPQRHLITKEESKRIFNLAERKLPPYLNTVFCLRYKHEYSIAEISQKVGVNNNVVRVYLSNAIKRIRKLLLKPKTNGGNNHSSINDTV